MIFKISLLAAVVSAQTITLSVPATKPTNAFNIPNDFVGFGFETCSLNQYNNDFTNNLIGSVASRMSAPPIIRVGGTSGDRVEFDPNQKNATNCVAGDCPWGSGATYILGPSYFDGFKGFPKARFTFQVPLGPKINETRIKEFIGRAYGNAGSRTAAIAIGNEVGGYERTAQDYVNAAEQVQKLITTEFNVSKVFEVLDLASGDINGAWNLQDAFQAGLDKNGLTKVAAEHWYQTDGITNVQSQLMNHSAITQKFTNYGTSLKWLQKNQPNIPYVLSETGSCLGGPVSSCDTFGATLWSIDFQLYSMSQGVARIDGSGRPAATHSLFVPIAGVPGMPGPSVRAPFYAQPFIADFAKGSIVSIKETDLLTAYAVYDPNLSKIAVVNLKEYTGGTRGSTTVTIKAKSAKIGRLTAAAGASAGGFDLDGHNITWAGQQWSYKNGRGVPQPQQAVFETAQIVNGMAKVKVMDSEAMIVLLNE